MKKFKMQKRDSIYYWGLVLMLTIPLALVLEFLKYSCCQPSHFPFYLLIYSWGYLLLLKSDLTAKICNLEEELKKMAPPVVLTHAPMEPEFFEIPPSPEF